MVKIKGDFNLIKNVLSRILKTWKGTTNWADNNTAVFYDSKKAEVGKVILKDLEATIEGTPVEDLWKTTQTEYEKRINEVVKQDQIDGTPLKGILQSPSNYGGIEKKPEIVKKLIAELKKLSISEVKIGGTQKQTSSIKNNLTLNFSVGTDGNGDTIEDGYFGRLRTFLFDNYETGKKTKETLNINEVNRVKNLEGEKSKKIEMNGMLIGEYYNERNLINLYFNPFKLFEFSIFDDTVPELFTDVFAVLKKIGVKKEDVSKIQEKIFITEFLGKSRERLESAKYQVKEIESNISNYERQIRTYIEQHTETMEEVAFIQQLIDSKGKGLYDEVKKVDKLPFVEKLEIEGTTIDIKYKPTFLPLPDFRRHDGGKTYGKRYIWIGSVGFKITPNNFSVYGDVDVGNSGHCHTHGSGFPSGSPCFGSGEGKHKIYNLLAGNQFVDLAKMLWFWIKTHVNGGAYVKCWTAYDSVLKQGYPVFDDKGKRIEINDPQRLKTGEQIQLTKSSNYEANKKKFAKSKLEA